MIYRFIFDHEHKWTIEMMCRVLMIKRSSYYAWRYRKDGKMASYRDTLEKYIKEEYLQSECRYGSPRITTELNSKGIKVSRKTVAKKYRTTTDSNHNYPVAENILNSKDCSCSVPEAYTACAN